MKRIGMSITDLIDFDVVAERGDRRQPRHKTWKCRLCRPAHTQTAADVTAALDAAETHLVEKHNAELNHLTADDALLLAELRSLVAKAREQPATMQADELDLLVAWRIRELEAKS
jgi:hypothetical protein